MTESDRIIAEVLRLDAEATKGPWNHIDGDGSVWHDDENQTCIANTDHCPNDNMDANAEMIAAYRTAAPRLARMLRVALGTMAHMRFACEEDEIEAYDEGLAEIEKIAKGEA